MITGDRRIFESGTEANARFTLQQSAVEELKAVFWGKGALIRPLFTKGKFDVVTSQDPFWRGLVAWFLARRLGARLNIQVHTDFEAETRAKPIRHILGQIVLRHADSVRVVSEKIKKQVVRIGVHASISTLPIFIDVPKFHSVRLRSHAGKNILWIGRFEDEKNPREAIEILKEVRKKIPDASLIMLGEGSWYQRLSDLARNLPIIVPQGWQNPLIHLDTADVLLSTSKHESWGAVFVEALAAGIPVVAPDVGIASIAGNVRVVPHKELAKTVVDVLLNPFPGELTLKLLDREEWAVAWKETL